MRIESSARFKELMEIVWPYLKNGHLRDDAPEDIRKLYKECVELGEREYNAALL